MTAPSICPRCARPAQEGTRFCAGCGARLGSAPPDFLRLIPMILGGALVIVLLLALVLRTGPSPRPATAPAPLAGPTGSSGGAGSAGPLPDLSSMTPSQRFERLYQRIITAAQSGDQATVTQFMPMAVEAFGMLDTVTSDARYHLAMLELHVGDLPGAIAQADTIKQKEPDHLFSYVIRAAVARWNQDDKARAAAYRAFLERYDAQIATRRPEYVEHQSMLEEVKRTASGNPTRPAS